jgi:LPS-assembly protein
MMANFSQAAMNNKLPLLLKADEINYHNQENIVIATGNVEISQGNEIIKADKIIFDRLAKIITAYGNVSMIDEAGNITFAQEMSLKDDLSSGYINKFSVRGIKDDTFAANTAEVKAKGVYKLNKAIYTSCALCGNKHPQWQIKAHKVKIDKNKQKVEYNNALFEIYGMPVFYSPYFSHSTPDVKRKSGFLMPKFSTNSTFGNATKVPYYINIAANKDATITPIFNQKSGNSLFGQYRHLTKKGPYEVEGSITDGKKIKHAVALKYQNRFHVKSKGDFQINPTWSTGYDVMRVSDIAYLREYHYHDQDFITSQSYLNYDTLNEYGSIKALNFKRLKIDNPQDPGSPNAIPYINYHRGVNLNSGLKYNFHSNVLGLTRIGGTSYRRISLTNAISLPNKILNGNLLSLETRLRTDLYDFNAKNNNTVMLTKTKGTANRVLPEAELQWRLPLQKQTENNKIMITPLANFIVSPNISHNSLIPNEDSAAVELNDTNLLNANHFSGYDRVETGPRTNYGIKGALTTKNGMNYNMLFGQSYRAKKNKYFTVDSGMVDKLSDYVARFAIKPFSYLDLSYRLLLDKKNLNSKRDEVGVNVSLKKWKLNVKYVRAKFLPFNNAAGITKTQMITNSSLMLSDSLTIGANMRNNLSKKKESMLEAGGYLKYHSDCTEITYNLRKDYTKSPLTNNKSIMTMSIDFTLKNLTD